MAEQHSEWAIHRGQYLGEISALCFLHLPSPLSCFPYLLAGSGSQMLLYDVEAGSLVSSFHVFEGIRVHGITCKIINSSIDASVVSTIVAFEIAVFSEKRVKLFNLNIDLLLRSYNQPRIRAVHFTSIHSLPKFSHWVLDVLFFKGHLNCLSEESNCLAIGCSDNSVHFWDILNSSILLKVQSPDRCLLYSMRLWGDSPEALRVASGTIYNEINIWKVIPQNVDPPLASSMVNNTSLGHSLSNSVQCLCQPYKAVRICTLSGHEGSIFRIVWSSNGSKLVSVSDDRSARIWAFHAEWKESDNLKEETVGPVLFGHNARVWDCCISDSLIVTAGEDCTCRVWGLDGKQLKLIREHIGRGIWRCLYDPNSSLLVTGGFDSALKVHQVHASLSWCLKGQALKKEFVDRAEILTASIPNSSEHIGLMDSKREYVRILRFAREDILYVATNHGYLYHAKFFDSGDFKWTALVRVSKKVAVVCMDLLSKNHPKQSCAVDDWVALGDGKGSITIVRVIGDVSAPKVGFITSWSAGLERQLLGIYWCKLLGERFVFSTDPWGALKLWRLCGPPLSISQNSARNYDTSLITKFTSLGMRIMCLDASFEEEVLVCGDLRGNLVIFPLVKGLLLGTSAASEVKISPLNYFKGAHGISSVSSISIARLCSNQIEIRSTGGDGCICYLEYDRDRQSLEFIGMKQVKELSLIQSVSTNNNSVNVLADCTYAAGFASTDFIIWNLITEAKVVQIPCGGWRRPHSYYLGDLLEKKNCFAYVKDEIIYVHRRWELEGERNIFPLNLHMQFHGREMHSLCFVSENLQASANGKQNLSDKSNWIATGCEDGTVRLTRYDAEVENWFASKLLGEHVGGSAVRSICCISKIYIITSNVTVRPEGANGQCIATEDAKDPYLLISVGAKRVLTSWLLRNRRLDNKDEALVDQQHKENANGYKPSTAGSMSMSFQWLSTDMPTKNSSTHTRTQDTERIVGAAGSGTSGKINAKPGPLFSEKGKRQSEVYLEDKSDDDWRYLAVTAFLIKCAGSRLTICFVVIACSDATLALRALILPHRLWFDVALLVPLFSPVLALQHIIIPICPPSEENINGQNVYIVISGATDGSVAFWDLTKSVEAFVEQLSHLNVENFIDCQKRPRTGRGSQGGRWWRSLGRQMSNRRRNSNLFTVKAGEEADSDLIYPATSGTLQKLNDMESMGTVSSQTMHKASHESKGNTIDFTPTLCEMSEVNPADPSPDTYEIQPLHILNNFHQSGVNCIHVSDIKDSQSSECGFRFNLVSGGDDQALHCLWFNMSLLSTESDSEVMRPCIINSAAESGSSKNPIHSIQNQIQNYRIRFSNHEIIASAHNSAIKGVWTDGAWVFSTGLDQRVRCWFLEEQTKLREHAHIITSVPEPEALDARACSKGHYQIAVAGRGLQMVDFYASSVVNGGE
ncbi:WD40 domain-containing protein [Cephalotus follicularis]|uniref:WD40 domain-containing protein n=1 Tax=Cephalotus follicularis TaxID=3775 RepID=A0A1Q3B7Y8_CEPFO|nr:WD40 domain-containing protein [Cephalotus follicularis]